MMIRLRKCTIAILLLVALPWFTQIALSQQVPAKPNIVLIMLDDAGWGDFASNGNPWVTTPHIDQIRQDGLMVNRFFVSPLCAPTRASLMTGKYHLRTGTAFVTAGLETMRTEETTMAEVFGTAGYNTGIFGKWHNGAHFPEDPLGQGFNEFLGFCAGHWTNYFDTKLQHNHAMIHTKGYITDVLTDAALDFIDKNKATPFLCYIPYNAPHGPFQVPDEYYSKYKQIDIPDRDKAIYAMIDNLDENIGRVLQKLDNLDLTKNTIVVFLTDNGPNSERYNGNMKGKKNSVHEGGCRVPLFIKWPGHIQPGLQIDKIAAHIDILPTLAELTGVHIPGTGQLDGKSLVPLIKNKNAEWPEREIFTHNYEGNKLQSAPGAIRNSKYRFVLDKKGSELYDMVTDTSETKNIASSEPALVKRFEQQYTAWYKDVVKKGIHTAITKIGYIASPVTELFSPDVSFKQGVAYQYTNGYAHDWLVGWDKENDQAEWTIEVVNDGEYEIALKYNGTEKFVGRTIIIAFNDQKLEKKVTKNYTGMLIPSPDRVPRIEAYEKEWEYFNMGKIKLAKGIYKLSVRATGKMVTGPLELKSLIVHRL